MWKCRLDKMQEQMMEFVLGAQLNLVGKLRLYKTKITSSHNKDNQFKPKCLLYLVLLEEIQINKFLLKQD